MHCGGELERRLPLEETLMIIGEPIIPKPKIEFRTEDEVFAKWEKKMDDKLHDPAQSWPLIGRQMEQEELEGTSSDRTEDD